MIETVAVIDTGGNISEDVARTIDLLGGMDSFVRKGDVVILKPNFVAPRTSEKGATTNLEIIKAVAEQVLRIGAKPILFERPGMEYDFRQVYNFLGVWNFAKENNIEIYDVAEGKIETVKLGGFRIPKILTEAKIINLPKLKTHVITEVTIALKNLMGLLPESQRRKMHFGGIHREIEKMNRVIHPVLNIVDATVAMDGDGAVYGDQVKLGKIIAGKNALAVDLVCCDLMNISSDSVQYIDYIQKKQGKPDIHLIGDGEKSTYNFKLPKKGNIYQVFYWGLYAADYLFQFISKEHFNEFMYETGLFGTRTEIVQEKCTRCGKCVSICPVAAINLDTLKVDRKKCIRCLLCYENCPYEAITVKGFSKPTEEES